MQKSRKLSLLVFVMAIVLCFSALTVALVSADGEPAGPKTTVTVDMTGKESGEEIVLENMTAGIYSVSLKGTDGGAQAQIILLVKNTQSVYSNRCNGKGKFNSPDALKTVMPCVLVGGNNTVSLVVKNAPDASITEMKLDLVKELKDVIDFWSPAQEVDGKSYVEFACPDTIEGATPSCTGPVGHTKHYYQCKNGDDDARRWDPKSTCYYSVDALPDANCYIRDLSSAKSVDYEKGEATFGSNDIGYTYPAQSTDAYGLPVRGSLYVRGGTTIKMTIYTDKPGTYELYSAYHAGKKPDQMATGMKSVLSVNGGKSYEETFSYTAVTDGSVFTLPSSASQMSSSGYGSFGTVELKAGWNTITFKPTGAWTNINVIAVTPEHIHTFSAGATATDHVAVECSCGTKTTAGAHVATAEDNNCTTATLCRDCGYVLAAAPAVAHTGGTATCKELAKCELCGTAYGEFAAHVGGTATCTDRAKCDVCGKGYGPLADHAYKVPMHDAVNHWKACQVCYAADPDTVVAHNGGTATCMSFAICKDCNNAYGMLAAHTGGAATCTSLAKCSVCSAAYGELAEHDFSAEGKDLTHHWNECADCGKIEEKVAHTGGTATCTAKAVCTECETAYGELAAHAYTVAEKDAANHWNKCAACGDIDDKAAHLFDATTGACACGEAIVIEEGCGSSIAAGAVIVTSILGLGIGFIRKKKED